MLALYLNQFFHPDTAATSQYLTDLARAPQTGHRAMVISGAPNYASTTAPLSPPIPGLANVHSIRIQNRAFSRSPIGRLASYFTFFSGATRAALGLAPRCDTIVTLTTPPFISLVGMLVRRFRRARHIMWEMDVYPDVTAVVDFPAPVRALFRATKPLARFIYSRADAIIVLGECMKQRLIRNGVAPEKLHVCPNWADGAEITPLPFPAPTPLTIHYSGNFGLAHDLNTIRDTINHLRHDPRFRFIFAGGGRLRDELRRFCESNGISTVTFEPYCDRADLGQSLAQGHLGLVTMNPKALGAVVPSKVYGIMAAGRPLLFIGPPEAEPALIINRFNCGWHVLPGDAPSLQRLLQQLAAGPSELQIRGARARQAFEQNYDKPIGVARVLRVIDDVAALGPVR